MPNTYILTPNGVIVNSDELCHYGVKGMKWGIRRYQNADGTLTAAGKKRQTRTIKKINDMYDRSNAHSTKLAKRFEKKGSKRKVAVLNEMIRRNESARREKTAAVKRADAEQYNKMHREDMVSAWRGGQHWTKRNNAHMATFWSRDVEYTAQRGMRRVLRLMSDNDLSGMSVKQAYEKIDNIQRIDSAIDNASALLFALAID